MGLASNSQILWRSINVSIGITQSFIPQNLVMMNLCSILFSTTLTPPQFRKSIFQVRIYYCCQVHAKWEISWTMDIRANPLKKFANELAPFLLLVYEVSLDSGSLAVTMRQAVMSLIHKKGKNILECVFFDPSLY